MPTSQPAVDARQFMADTKFYEGYSRLNEATDKYETWEEAVERVIAMHRYYYKDKEGLEPYLEKASQAYKESRALGAQRALQFGGAQILKHHMKMYNCFSQDTRFLTSTGIQSFSNFNSGDNVVVKTHTGSWKNAIVRNYGKQDLYEIKIGKTQNSLKTFYATKNHRWILEDGIITTDLQVGDVLAYFEDETFSLFDWETATSEERLYWCYGYVYGDGSKNKEYSHVRLCGNDTRFVNRFAEFGWKTSSPHSIQGDVYVFTGRYQKTLPDPNIDSIEMIRAFAAGYLDADGTKGNNYWNENSEDFSKHFSAIYAKKEEASNFIRDIFPLVGIWPISEKITNRITNFGIHDGVSFGISSRLKYNKLGQKYKVYSIEKTKRYEDVWCLEVEDDKSFILEGGIVTGNCTSSYADRPEFFGEFFYILLCGAGAGFSVQKHHIAKFPKIAERKKQPKTHVIEDSIEGWAAAADVLLSSYFVGGGKHPEFEGRRVFFDTSLIRPKGAYISGGFKAPGPDGLRLALDRVEHLLQRLILIEKTDRLRPIHVYDICMHLSDAVLSGGVRRSASICLFSPDDQEMLVAKTGSWYKENPQRARSNNSVVLVRDEVSRDDFSNYLKYTREFGEPGFVFVSSREHTTNPCVEIGMFPQIDGKSGWQGCNLTEINGGMCNSAEDFYRACEAAAILGTLQAGYTDFKFLSETSRKIFDREALLGCSVTGWMNSPKVLFNKETLQNGAQIIKDTNRKLAKILGINPAARWTCTKPAGTTSIFLKSSSGIHGEHAAAYIRNMQLNKESEVAKLILKYNPSMVEESAGSAGKTDYSVSFPIVPKEGSLFTKDLYGVKLLEKVKFVQENWVEAGTDEKLCADKNLRHNVSNTITVDNWEEVERYVYDNRQYFAGISFMAAKGDKAYYQAPLTSVIFADDIVKKYGTAGVLASGLIVDCLEVFDNLWNAISTYNGIGEDLSFDSKENSMKKDWLRRFEKFADNYLDGDINKAEECLKDVYLLHKWEKIQQSMIAIDWPNELKHKDYVDVDTLGAIACAGGACEIDF